MVFITAGSVMLTALIAFVVFAGTTVEESN